MKKQIYAFLMTIALLGFATGCDKPVTGEGHGDGHTHGPDDGHDHGDAGHDEHAHPHEGPHNGAIVEWGEHEYHVEFTVDHQNKLATVYILGDDVKTPVAIAASEITLAIKEPPCQVILKASPLEGETAEKSSRFVGNHDNLGVVANYEGAISGVIDGTPYSGNFKEEAHEH